MASTENPLLCFVHVPKTGGTSLQVILEDPIRYGHSGARPVFHIGRPEDAARFLALPAPEQDRHLGVFGHMPFGIDRRLARPVRYITFLRDPVERTLSSYAHTLRQLDHPDHAAATALGIDWTGLPGNLQSVALSDYAFDAQPAANGAFWWNGAPFRPLREHLEAAKRNLERCDFVGITETYDEDLQALRQLDGFSLDIPPRAPREQVGSNRTKAQALSELQREQIALANRADRELYDYALELRRDWGGPLRPAGWTGSGGEQQSPVTSRGRALGAWRAQPVAFYSHVDRRPLIGFPFSARTPTASWDYGVSSDLLDISHAAKVRVRLTAREGTIGLALVSEDYGRICLEGEGVTAGEAAQEVLLDYRPAFGPVRLLIRNHGDEGWAGAADILGVDVFEQPAA
jgi:hypothetical protein